MGQSLSAGSNDHTGWSEFRGGQIALLNDDLIPDIQDLTRAMDAQPASEAPTAEFKGGADQLRPLPIVHQQAHDQAFSFGSDLLILKPRSEEAKALAEIIEGQRPWPTAVPEGVRSQLEQIYADREFQPIFWQGDTGWRPGLDAALFQVAQAHLDGLNGDDYLIDEAYGYIAASDRIARAEADLIMAAVIVPYAHDMLNGRYVRKARVNVADVFNQRMADNSLNDFMAALIPSKVEYLRLRDYLAELRATQEETISVPLFSDGRHLRQGDEDARVGELRQILALTGDYQTDAQSSAAIDQPNLFDESLHQAVMAFQARKGLSADGIVGRGRAAP